MSERGGIDLISALRANDTDRLVAGADADEEEHSDRRRLLDDTDDDLFTLVESIIVDVDVYRFAFKNILLCDWGKVGYSFFKIIIIL
jgi:hypothetical protein